MPPKAVKRGGSTAGAKRGGRGSRGTPRGKNNQPEVAEEPKRGDDLAVEGEDVGVKVESSPKPVDTSPAVKVEEEVVVERPEVRVGDGSVVEREIKVEPVSEDVEPVAAESSAKIVEEEVKESNHEDEKDERLDLDDNDQEYEPEEYCGMDSDEKESEPEEYQEQDDEPSGEGEEDNAGEEDVDNIGEEEIEEVAEEYEGEEDDGGDGEQDQREGAVAAQKDHQEALKERRKRKEFEVFVGGLDKDATEEDLKKVFGKVGEVTEVRLMRNPQTKKNKGFAFLRFATVEQAKRAVTELTNPTVRGKPCGVSPSQDSDTLFLGNICKTWTKEALKAKLKAYGIENIDDLTLVEDGDNKSMNRGFAFLEFSSRTEAKDAFRRLQKRDVTFGIDRPAKVSFADSFIDPGDEIMAKVRTVFVDGLHPSWDEDQVRDILKKYGKIEKIELARNMPSAKRKDFGFVTFDNHDIAVTCAKSINNTDLGDGDKKAKVRARLSRPLQKSRGKHGSRVDTRRSRAPTRSARGPLSHLALRSPPRRGPWRVSSRDPPTSIRRPLSRPALRSPPRAKPIYSPPRSYDRRPPVPPYTKSISARDYSRREELTPRSRPHTDYDHRVVLDRRQSYRVEYSPRVSGYPDISRPPPRAIGKRGYADDGYAQRFERPPGYREGRARDYDSVSGSKRPYSALDETPPHYADVSVRQSRSRLDYEISASQYVDAYSDRQGRNSVGYSSRSLPSSHDSRGLYSSRQGSYGGSDVGGVYSSSSYAGDFTSRRPDVSSRSYSSLYSNRGVGNGSYIGSGSSGSYY
uniref:RRM domain-containing protein n=1 Tax=Kalanchoe fedtschenkoi TaxID=63787 RepID=A0A7N0V8K6_KALFE